MNKMIEFSTILGGLLLPLFFINIYWNKLVMKLDTKRGLLITICILCVVWFFIKTPLLNKSGKIYTEIVLAVHIGIFSIFNIVGIKIKKSVLVALFAIISIILSGFALYIYTFKTRFFHMI